MKYSLIYFLFSFLFLNKINSIWINNNKCNRIYNEELLYLIAPELPIRHLIHSCSKHELKNYSQEIYSLKWEEKNYINNNNIWKIIYSNMANKTIVLVGDSVMFQVLIGLILFLNDIGINCKHLNDGFYECPNGLKINRPFFIAQFKNDTIQRAFDVIYPADIAIVNTGLHYGAMGCQQTDVCKDIKYFFNTLIKNKTQHQTTVKVAWIDTFLPHFPAPNGSYALWKQEQNQQANPLPSCGKISQPMSYNIGAYESSHTVKKYFPNIPIIVTYDILYDRHDVHLGMLTHKDPNRLDCVHLCFQPCFWEAIFLRMGEVILKLLHKKTKTNLNFVMNQQSKVDLKPK